MASLLSTLFGGGAEKDAANANKTALANYYTTGTNNINNAYSTANGYLNDALSAYQPLSDLASKYTAGTDLYLNALGVNGASGTQAAQDAFTASPGYQYTLDQGLDALNRRAATTGMYNSGNADQDTLAYASNLANSDYNNWLSNLSGINNDALSATSGAANGIAGVNGSLANSAVQQGTDLTSLLGNLTSGTISANNLQAQGEANGAKNLLSGGLGLASLGLKSGGTSGFGSALGSALGSAIIGL